MTDWIVAILLTGAILAAIAAGGAYREPSFEEMCEADPVGCVIIHEMLNPPPPPPGEFV